MDNNSSRRHRIRCDINIKALVISIIYFSIAFFLCAITWKPSYIKYVKDYNKEWYTKTRCTYTLLSKEFLPVKRGEGECWFILKNSKEKISLEVNKETYLSSDVGDILTFSLTKCDRFPHEQIHPFLSNPILYYILIGFIGFIVLALVNITVLDAVGQTYDGSDLVIPRKITWASFLLIVISGIIVNILVYA